MGMGTTFTSALKVILASRLPVDPEHTEELGEVDIGVPSEGWAPKSVPKRSWAVPFALQTLEALELLELSPIAIPLTAYDSMAESPLSSHQCPAYSESSLLFERCFGQIQSCLSCCLVKIVL
jgi:hypothetical protein